MKLTISNTAYAIIQISEELVLTLSEERATQLYEVLCDYIDRDYLEVDAGETIPVCPNGKDFLDARDPNDLSE